MKKVLVFILILTLLGSLCSCRKKVSVNTTNIDDFKKTFDYCVGKTHVSLTKIPYMLKDGGKIVDYAAKYEFDFFPGDYVQIKLSVQYEKDVFEDKVRELANYQDDYPVLRDTENFILPAYVATIGYVDICEYVLVEEDALTLHYFLLQSELEKDLIFDRKYLPKGYHDYSDVDGLKYSIYSSLRKAGEA